MIHIKISIWRIVIAAMAMVVIGQSPLSAFAASAKSKYFAAEQCYRQLSKHPAKQKYRDHWRKCIDKYLAVYNHAPRGKWAAAGLYNAGRLYAQLYKRSFLNGDKKKASDLFNRVIRKYPKSRYRKKAIVAKQAMLKKVPPRKKIVKVPPRKKILKKKKDAARAPYQRAQAHYQRLQKNPKLKRFRDQWLKCISDYRKAFQSNPKGPLAAASVYGIARSFDDLYYYSRRSDDKKQAKIHYRKLISAFPKNKYAEKARAALPDEIVGERGGKLDGDDVAQLIKDANINPVLSGNNRPSASSRQQANVSGLRFWSNPRYTRVVIDTDKDTIFTYHELREDPAIGKPQRIYIDLHNCRLGKNLQKVIPINDNLLSDARAGQYTADTVRVVVDLKSSKTFKIFSLKNPFRVVLDVWGVEKEGFAKATEPKDRTGKKLQPSAIVKQLALGVRRVVIDPGHGGKDYGAPGYLKGIHEKNVVLQFAKQLKQMIRDQIKCEVVLTRNNDKYLSLEERTAIANTQNADLFISIHTNASTDRRAHGIETYILNLATDDEAIRVAAMENATSTRNISDLDSILQDLMNNAKVSESTRLGSYVQQYMTKRLKKKYKNIRNKGVKQAPFYVLLGAEMPSILIETSFISNPRECKRLINKYYRTQICQGIVDGIKQYIKETHPTAFQPPSTKKKRS